MKKTPDVVKCASHQKKKVSTFFAAQWTRPRRSRRLLVLLLLLRRPQRRSLRTRSLQSRTPLPLSRATPRWLRLRTRARAPLPSATSSRASSSTRRRRASGLGAPRGRASRRSSLTPRLRQGAAEWKKKREEGREREREFRKREESIEEHRWGKNRCPPHFLVFFFVALTPSAPPPPHSAKIHTKQNPVSGSGRPWASRACSCSAPCCT